jgi:dynein light chain roadblock-type
LITAQSELDERIKRIIEHQGVKALLIVNYSDGKEKFVRCEKIEKGLEATNYGNFLSTLARQARNMVRDLDPSNDLAFLRVQCKKHDYMIAPDKDYFLIVVQANEE